MRGKKGFTLLELVVVEVIIGVLATVALPRFYETVEFSYSAEALNTMGIVKRAFERCGQMAGTGEDYSRCRTFDQIGLVDPTHSLNSHFIYDFDWTPPVLTITAFRNAVDNGDGTSWIQMTYDTSGGTVARGGGGVFASIK